MDLSGMSPLADKVSKRSGKPKLAVMLDMVYCGLKYQAGYTDYELFAMERADAEQRKTYVTRGINDRLVSRYNSPSHRHVFFNKDEFNDRFDRFLGREWIKIKYPEDSGYDFNAECERLKSFCEGKNEIVSKVRDGMCGKGVDIIKPEDYPSAEELYKYLQSQNSGIVEECIVQNDEMNKLYPGSINTVRMVTINNGKKVTLVTAYCRIGNGGRVDNFLSGGMMTRVSVEDGKFMYDAVDSENKVYEKHPLTGTVFKGFQIPMWDECVKLVKEAATVVPEVGYVGWDVAITPDRPVLVEGNEFPGHCLYQLPPHTPDNYGLLPLFENAAKAE